MVSVSVAIVVTGQGDRVMATAWAWEPHVPGSPGEEEQPSGTSMNMDRNSHSALTWGLSL